MNEITEPKKSFIRRFWWTGIVVVLIIVAIALIASARLRSKKSDGKSVDSPTIGTVDKNSNTQSQKSNDQLSSLPACKNTKELFATFPIKDGEYTSITPLGNLNPPSHTFPTDHIYIGVADPQHPEKNTLANAKSLISPADIWILKVSMSEEIGGISDYAIEFSPCKDVKGQFGHVGSISTTIKNEIDKIDTKCNEYETGGSRYRNCQYNNLKIQVKAGEKIGTAGSERSGLLDIWMSDYREPQIKRANPAVWSEDRNYVSCFLDYYPALQKNNLYELLLGPNETKRTKEPRCGTVDVDIEGTAQGVWFYNLQGQFQLEDQHLALVFDNIQTDKQVFSVGTAANSAGIASGTYGFIPKTDGKVNRDFSQVTADGSVYCYDTKGINNTSDKAIILTMPTAEKLRINKSPTSCGTGPWQMQSDFVEYSR